MTDFTHEITELTTHAQHLDGLAVAMDDVSSALSATGVGSTSMYGILVGQIAHPVLSHVADSKSAAITDLGTVLHSTTDTLHTAVETYADAEQSAAERSRAVENDIQQIPIPTN